MQTSLPIYDMKASNESESPIKNKYVQIIWPWIKLLWNVTEEKNLKALIPNTVPKQYMDKEKTQF